MVTTFLVAVRPSGRTVMAMTAQADSGRPPDSVAPQRSIVAAVFRRSRREAGPEAEQLGVVSTGSGNLLVFDFGMIRMWSGTEPPLLSDGVAPPSAVAAANRAVDYEIAGTDAAEAAALLDLASVTGRWAFDIPDPTVLNERLDAVARTRGLEASAVPIGRVPHLERARILLADNPDGTEVPFHGMWAVAVTGLPTGQELPVRGVRMDPDGPDAGRWKEVWVECSTAPVARTVKAGYVLVDAARLLFAEPEVLGRWRSDVSLDGRADVVFWGRDAQAVAERVGASVMGPDGRTFGWANLPVDEAVRREGELQSLRGNGTAFAIDFRPHDDHYEILARMRASGSESAVITCGEQTVTGFFTSWGDGAFPAFTDWDASGRLVRFRVELGAEEIVRRTRRFERLWFGDLSEMAIVSARVATDGKPVAWMYREETDRQNDSGWRMFAGDETQEYSDSPDNAVVVPLREILKVSPDIEAVLGQPAGSAFERGADGAFQPAPPPETRP